MTRSPLWLTSNAFTSFTIFFTHVRIQLASLPYLIVSQTRQSPLPLTFQIVLLLGQKQAYYDALAAQARGGQKDMSADDMANVRFPATDLSLPV